MRDFTEGTCCTDPCCTGHLLYMTPAVQSHVYEKDEGGGIVVMPEE